MQERDRSAEPKTDEQVKRRNWMAEAQRHLVETQLCLAHAAEEEDPAAEMQPLGSDIIAYSRLEEDDPPRLTLVLPEWPPKLRPYEAGLYPGQHRKEVRNRWEAMVRRALESGGLNYFHPSWHEATILFSLYVPRLKLGDPDHFVFSFIINALRKAWIIQDDSWENVVMGGLQVVPTTPEKARTVVHVVQGRYWPGDNLALTDISAQPVLKKSLDDASPTKSREHEDEGGEEKEFDNPFAR